MELLTQVSDALIVIKQANEVLSSLERDPQLGVQNKSEHISALQQLFSNLEHMLKNTEQAIELLCAKNQHLETEIRQKNHELVEMSLSLMRKKKLVDNFISQASQILQTPSDDKNIRLENLKRELAINENHEFDWNDFQKQFTKVHPKFIQELFKRCPILTPTEVKVSCLMRIGLSTKEIMQLMRVTIRDIETHRYKIRKKLGLSTKVNLITYLSGLHTDILS